ncbi:hypothetical protein ACFSQE_11930 [Vogesella fluminis]|uniref:hypothetical protein n=1 Tax=Vogesella fluminis TaxID=1069161 RepID=UPI001678462B|nr:hypothetical protein [Vogesella fluminis]
MANIDSLARTSIMQRTHHAFGNADRPECRADTGPPGCQVCMRGNTQNTLREEQWGHGGRRHREEHLERSYVGLTSVFTTIGMPVKPYVRNQIETRENA